MCRVLGFDALHDEIALWVVRRDGRNNGFKELVFHLTSILLVVGVTYADQGCGERY
jgi:hypothetical protein